MTATAQTNPPEGTLAVPIRLNADPLDWPQLPKPAKVALRRLRRARDDAWHAWRVVADERQEAWDAKRAVEAQLKLLTGGRPDSAWYSHTQHASFQKLPDDDLGVATELGKLEDVAAELGRLGPIVDERSQRSQQCGRLVTAVEAYLNGCGRAAAAFKVYKGPEPSPQKRESPVDAVERCRRRLRELDADRHRVASAPWHSSEAKRRARAEIDAFAERGQPSVLPLIESCDGSIYWAERPFTDVVIGGRLVSAVGDPQALPLLFWLHRDAIFAKIEQQIDAVADDANSLTERERAEQIGEIDRDRLAVQREEEHWIGAAVDAGMTMLRRPDADPRAVLGLADDMPAPMNT